MKAELVIDVSNHREGVGARDEVLLDDDCSTSACSYETASAALKHHVSGRDSGAEVHPAILDNYRKAIAVGSHIRNFAGDVGGPQYLIFTLKPPPLSL
jgi:hypothetical protein